MEKFVIIYDPITDSTLYTQDEQKEKEVTFSLNLISQPAYHTFFAEVFSNYKSREDTYEFKITTSLELLRPKDCLLYLALFTRISKVKINRMVRNQKLSTSYFLNWDKLIFVLEYNSSARSFLKTVKFDCKINLITMKSLKFNEIISSFRPGTELPRKTIRTDDKLPVLQNRYGTAIKKKLLEPNQPSEKIQTSVELFSAIKLPLNAKYKICKKTVSFSCLYSFGDLFPKTEASFETKGILNESNKKCNKNESTSRNFNIPKYENLNSENFNETKTEINPEKVLSKNKKKRKKKTKLSNSLPITNTDTEDSIAIEKVSTATLAETTNKLRTKSPSEIKVDNNDQFVRESASSSNISKENLQKNTVEKSESKSDLTTNIKLCCNVEEGTSFTNITRFDNLAKKFRSLNMKHGGRIMTWLKSDLKQFIYKSSSNEIQQKLNLFRSFNQTSFENCPEYKVNEKLIDISSNISHEDLSITKKDLLFKNNFRLPFIVPTLPSPNNSRQNISCDPQLQRNVELPDSEISKEQQDHEVIDSVENETDSPSTSDSRNSKFDKQKKRKKR